MTPQEIDAKILGLCKEAGSGHRLVSSLCRIIGVFEVLDTVAFEAVKAERRDTMAYKIVFDRAFDYFKAIDK